jgi:CRP-like cAMP-binding protein
MHNVGTIQAVTKPFSFAVFNGLGNHEIQIIREAATKRTYEAFQIIKNSEEPTAYFFLAEVGFVDYFVLTSDGREILLRRLVAGDTFGNAALLAEPMGYLGTVRAVDKAEILVWERRVARQLAVAYPRLVENAIHTSLHYLALYAQRHIRLVSNMAQEKVAYALADLGSRTGHVLPAGVEVDIKNEDLASLADVSSFTVSRILGEWERENVVSKTRGSVLILRPEKMLAAPKRGFLDGVLTTHSPGDLSRFSRPKKLS